MSINLLQRQIIDKLVNCQSANSFLDVLQEQAQAFRNFLGDDSKLMTCFKRTVNVLYPFDLVRGSIWYAFTRLTKRTQHNFFFYPTFLTSKSNSRGNGYTS